MDERFTPQMTIEHYTRQKGITCEEIGVAPVVVVSWSRTLIQSMARKVKGRVSKHWWYGARQAFYYGEYHGRPVTLVQLPVGAPGTVLVLEELIAAGAQIVIGLGWAGSLQPDLPVGAMIVPTACLRQEGTSLHYIASEGSLVPDPALADTLYQAALDRKCIVARGLQWTTDAPYRELKCQIDAYRQQGVLGVDMETSAMYALAQYRKIRTCNLLVVSDEVWDDWNPAFGTPEIRQATDRARQVILDCVEVL